MTVLWSVGILSLVAFTLALPSGWPEKYDHDLGREANPYGQSSNQDFTGQYPTQGHPSYLLNPPFSPLSGQEPQHYNQWPPQTLWEHQQVQGNNQGHHLAQYALPPGLAFENQALDVYEPSEDQRGQGSKEGWTRFSNIRPQSERRRVAAEKRVIEKLEKGTGKLSRALDIRTKARLAIEFEHIEKRKPTQQDMVKVYKAHVARQGYVLPEEASTAEGRAHARRSKLNEQFRLFTEGGLQSLHLVRGVDLPIDPPADLSDLVKSMIFPPVEVMKKRYDSGKGMYEVMTLQVSPIVKAVLGQYYDVEQRGRYQLVLEQFGKDMGIITTESHASRKLEGRASRSAALFNRQSNAMQARFAEHTIDSEDSEDMALSLRLPGSRDHSFDGPMSARLPTQGRSRNRGKAKAGDTFNVFESQTARLPTSSRSGKGKKPMSSAPFDLYGNPSAALFSGAQDHRQANFAFSGHPDVEQYEHQPFPYQDMPSPQTELRLNLGVPHYNSQHIDLNEDNPESPLQVENPDKDSESEYVYYAHGSSDSSGYHNVD